MRVHRNILPLLRLTRYRPNSPGHLNQEIPKLASTYSQYFQDQKRKKETQEVTLSIPSKTKSVFKDLAELTKFKLSVLNTAVAFSMYSYFGPIGALDSSIFIGSTLSIAMSSQAYNQTVEMDKDALMKRTKNRPLPSGRISKDRALLVAGTFWTIPFFGYSGFQPYTLWVAMAVWSGYGFIYTPLKSKTSLNTGVGAIVGALPPLIGSFAQLGQLYQPQPLLLCLYIFAWQFPHFYGILYQHKEDYSRAHFVMISDEDPDGQRASRHMLLAHLIMQGTAYSFYCYNMLPLWAFLGNFAGQLNGLKKLYEFRKKPNEENSRAVKNSVYLPFLSVLMGIYISGFLKKRRAAEQSGNK